MVALKRSVAFDREVGEEALDVAGEGGFSKFVNDAVAQRLQAVRFERMWAEHVARNGSDAEAVLAEVGREWDEVDRELVRQTATRADATMGTRAGSGEEPRA